MVGFTIRKMRKISWLCIFLLVLTIFGCSSPNKEKTNETSLKKELKEDIPVEESYAYLIEDTEENIISIKMPEDKQYNSIIEKHILEEIRDTWGETFDLIRSKTDISNKDRDYSDFLLELNTTITYASENVVSVVVEGLFNKKTTAHPTHWFFTINFNPKTCEIVRFSDYYELDARVYELFSDAIIKKVSQQNGGVWPEVLDDFSDHFCSQEDFLRDMADGTMYYYFTEDGVEISCKVIFSMGNHMEVELPYDVLIKK